jgi:hypothetical protein
VAQEKMRQIKSTFRKEARERKIIIPRGISPFQYMQTGLPDFSWYMIPKGGKNVTN